MTIYNKRRKKLLSLIPNGIALISSGSNKQRSNDTEFPFRQDSNFDYLTGFEEDGALLAICSKHQSFKSVLFVTPKDPKMELWSGKRTGVDKCKEIYDYDEVYSIEDLDKELPKLFENHKKLYLDLYNDQKLLNKSIEICKMRSIRRRKPGDITPEEFINIQPTIGRLRLIKEKEEIELIKKACAISDTAYKAVLGMIAPGKNEKDIEVALEYLFKKEGGMGPAYGTIAAAGDNANTLHYIKNNCELKDGDMILIDAGAEYKNYASDVSRTIPINGKFSEPQKELYQVVLNAMKASFKASKPGNTLLDVHNASVKKLIEGMLELGILKGDAKEIEEKGVYRKYYPHGTSHWIGLDVHDNTPHLTEDSKRIELAKGMLFSVEPGLYIPADDQEAPQKFRGIGIRIEDDILITETGYENLTESIPKEIDNIEKGYGQEYKDYFSL